MRNKIKSLIIPILLIFSSVFAESCSDRKDLPKRSEIIPQNDLVQILADIYIADGLLMVPELHTVFAPVDSMSTYIHVIELHGYSKKDFDNTIRYYFVKQPKKLIEIYDKVLGVLSQMESRYEKQVLPDKDRLGELWPGENSYYFPDPKGSDSVRFRIVFENPGIYEFKYSVTLFPDDQTLNPATRAFIVHADSIGTGKPEFIRNIEFLKDGMPHTYNLPVNVSKGKPVYIEGSLIDYENNPDSWGIHAIVDSISVVYKQL